MKIIFVSDDYGHDKLPLYLIETWHEHSLKLVTNFGDWEKIGFIQQAAFIDFGLIGQKRWEPNNAEEKRIEILCKAYQSGVKLIWTGGLPEYSNQEAQKLWPDIYYLHKLEYCEMSDVNWMIGKLVGE